MSKSSDVKPLGIIGAMDEEIAVIRSKMTDTKEAVRGLYSFIHGILNELPVVLLQSGIGKVNAAIGTTLLIEAFNPSMIINTGSAGGIEPSLAIGDIIIAQQILHHDVDTTAFGYAKGQIPKMPTFFEPDPKLLETALGMGDRIDDARIFVGLIASGDSFMHDKRKLNALRKDHPGLLAVEMESAAIAQTCYQLTLPYLILRSISDLANRGSAKDFKTNIHLASANSAAAVLRVLEEIEQEDLNLSGK
jgi:adenosylhomocysteine nucleosidase